MEIIPSRMAEALRAQRTYFDTGATHSRKFRIEQLRKLESAFRKNEALIIEALRKDLGRPALESYVGEIDFLYQDIRHSIRHLKTWMRPKKVSSPPLIWPGTSRIYASPRGSVLIVGPWNYPFQLAMVPLVGAIAAGNTSIVKPSELAPNVSAAITQVISQAFRPEYIQTVEGGIEVSQALLTLPFDHIFFTGSTQVGRIVMRAAAEHLVPVTLELGGKSPCIVDESASLELAAKRIIWGKFYNAGQTCVAPDYVLAQKSIKPKLIEKLKAEIVAQFGIDPSQSQEYCKIINERHFDRLATLIDASKLAHGGRTDRARLHIEPTLMDRVDFADPIMNDEIFGPILPILEFDSLDEIPALIRNRPNPLSLYIFSSNHSAVQHVLETVPFGGGCVNDTVLHLCNPNLPFGGVRQSGIGAYHGEYSFQTFSHFKGVVHKSTWLDPIIRYRPYSGWKLWVLRKLGVGF